MRDRAALRTFADVLQWRAAEQPRTTAFTWLGNGRAAADVDISYADLDRRARAIGARLQAQGPAGERALLLFAPGLDFVAALFGCFYAGWVAVPAYPPPLNQRLDRIQTVLRDADPRVALTSRTLLTQVQARLGHAPELPHLRWLVVDGDSWTGGDQSASGADRITSGDRTTSGDQSTSGADRITSGARTTLDDQSTSGDRTAGGEGSGDWRPSRWRTDHLAVLQYTSGSTATPRGVMLSHANLLHNTAQIEQRFGILGGGESRGVIWLPPYHDMGLVGGILAGVFAGFPIGLMAPVAFLQRPRRWLEAITRTRATISGGPNFAFDLCVDRIPPADRAGLDLSSWQVAFNGAEPVRETTLRRFTDAFGPFGFRSAAFYPCYGLAEATLIVTGGSATAAPVVLEGDRSIVGCGHSIDDQQVLIVDASTGTPCDPGQVGEVWVTGPSVAAGYWHQPSLNDEVFGARPTGPARAHRSPPPSPGGSGSQGSDTHYLRTGDLGFVTNDGELCITGRLKAVLILSGRKIQAEDIEATLAASQAATRPAGRVALSVEADGDERLVIVQEADSPRQTTAELASVARCIRAQVAAAHQLPVWAVVLTRRGGVPKTSSGKVQRAACKAAFMNHQLQVAYEWRAALPRPG